VPRMKLTTIIATAIAAISLAACGSTVTPTSRPATPSLTAAPTPTTTPAPTPIVTPTATPTPTPTPGVSATVTCSNVPEYTNFAYRPGSVLGIATFTGVTVGDVLSLGVADATPVTSDPFTGPPGSSLDGFTQGTWDWVESSGVDVAARGTLTSPACPPSMHVSACDHVGTASGGALSWSDTDYSTLTVTGPQPSAYHFTVPASTGQYGPLSAGVYSYTFNAYMTSLQGAVTIPACLTG
jgi:hypothetical protein